MEIHMVPYLISEKMDFKFWGTSLKIKAYLFEMVVFTSKITRLLSLVSGAQMAQHCTRPKVTQLFFVRNLHLSDIFLQHHCILINIQSHTFTHKRNANFH